MSQAPPPPLMPPSPLNYAPPPGPNKLRDVAVRQKAVMYCILAYFILVISQFVVPKEMALFLGLAAIGVSLTAAVFVFMLALTVYNTGTGIVLGILTLVPLVGLIVLLIINSKATTILRQHGIQVGLMGASLDRIPR